MIAIAIHVMPEPSQWAEIPFWRPLCVMRSPFRSSVKLYLLYLFHKDWQVLYSICPATILQATGTMGTRGTGRWVQKRQPVPIPHSTPTPTPGGVIHTPANPYTASISQCFMTKHCKRIEERDTLLFTILSNKKDKYHTASFSHFLCQDMIWDHFLC